jgi:methyl-accepting chemotaxis protein
VAGALGGKAYEGFELGAGGGLAYMTALPLKGADGAVAGVVLAGCTMAQDGLLDSLKKIHGTDFTIFAGDVRLVTTNIQDGKRVVGTKLAAATADKVIKGKQTYYGQATILNQQYLTAYEPLLDASGSPAGVLFARSGLLVEGETEAWLLARICGYGFPNLSR